jgi:hypothetical protein
MPLALCAAALLGAFSFVSPAHAGEAEELRALRDDVARERAEMKKEREALQEQRKRVDEALAEVENAKAAPDGSTMGGVSPAAVAAAKEERAHLDVYGFVQLDAIHDFDRVDPTWNATLRSSRIPVNCPGDAGCLNDGESIFSVRQSRLGFKGYVPTPLGTLKTIFEFDLFGVGVDAGQTTFRLRHAWGELGDFGAGQTWSLFMDPDVFPNTVDYWGPSGMVFLRNPQIRWTPWFLHTEGFKVALALESPGSGIDQGKLGLIDPNLAVSSWNTYPDVTAQLQYGGEWGHVQLAGIFRALGFEGTSPLTGNNFRGREPGWGVNASSVLNLGFLPVALVERDQVLVQVVYGAGISNYMNDGGVDLAPDVGLTGAHAVSIPTFGWLAYYNRTWNDQWTSSIGFSEHYQDTADGQAAGAMERIQYFSVNTLYHPVPEMFVGPEVLWGSRKNRDNESDTDTRIQLSFKYNFAGTIGGDR